MNRIPVPKLLFFLLMLCCRSAFAQYVLNGSARAVSCNCYTLTPPTEFLSGSVWNGTKINLNNPFDFWFNIYLGCNDNGADGIVFMLQPLSTNVGSSGEGMGFAGVSPSIGIALDTYQNTNLNDPAYDHISIQANGNINHNNDLAGPVPISAVSNNVEDCQWHKLRISWDPAGKWLRSYFDGVLRVEKQVDLIAGIFNNDPMVYWGFSGATGGAVNLQQFCTALDPYFNTNYPNNIACAGDMLQFNSLSESFAPIASYNWDFGDGSNSTQANPPPHLYAMPGRYPVTLKIRGLDNCENDTTRIITIGSFPHADLQVFDTCFTRAPRIVTAAPDSGLSYQWVMDGTVVPAGQGQLDQLSAGNHQLQLIAASLYGCGLPDTATASFIVKPVPQIDANKTQLCQDLQFMASQLDQQTTITQWNWTFGDGQGAQSQNTQHHYSLPGQYIPGLWVESSNGCTSDTVHLPFTINRAIAFAGNDTVVIRDLPFQLHAQGNGSFLWSPSTGVSDDTIADPIVTLNESQDFFLTVTTAEGCTARDTIHVKPMTGPTVYMPTAFTPNHDGLNDILLPVYVGITRLERFSVYDRWGQVVFSTHEMGRGWDGTIQGKIQGNSSYVWIIKAVNYLNKPVELKGIVTLIN